MATSAGSRISRFIARVFPRMPDFYGMLNEQCDLAVEAMDALVAAMETGAEEKAQAVVEIEHRADGVKARNIDALHRAFSTPMDREELYRAITGIDHVINYAKSTVREMQDLRVPPDARMLEMSRCLRDGAVALRSGFAKLADDPAAAEPFADAARKAERRTEKVYRRAVAELFEPDPSLRELKEAGPDALPAALTRILDNFRRREIYRHLSNAADRLAHAGDTLHDIVVKNT